MRARLTAILDAVPRARRGRVTFCDGCGGVCTPACRADGARRRAQETALRSGLPR